MKLALATCLALLALPVVSAAEPLRPPGGPVYADDDVPMADVDVDVRIDAQPGPRAHGDRGHGKADKRELRAALFAAFDTNHDGQLGPRERLRALMVVRKIERKLEASLAREGREHMQRRRGERPGTR